MFKFSIADRIKSTEDKSLNRYEDPINSDSPIEPKIDSYCSPLKDDSLDPADTRSMSLSSSSKKRRG